MDAASTWAAAKQCLLLTCAMSGVNIVAFGSAAMDLYIHPCMRFGETGSRQDIDLILVSSGDGATNVDDVDQFALAVTMCIERNFPSLIRTATWYTNMVSNGVYCAHLFIKKLHYADITLIPRAANDLVEAAFPRVTCPLTLSLFPTETETEPVLPVPFTITVASLLELLHRLACISESVPNLDGLPVVESQYNTAAIRKSRLRLERLQYLRRAGMLLLSGPGAWVCDADIVPPPFPVVGTPTMPRFMPVNYVKHTSDFLAALDGMTESFTRRVSDRLATLNSKLVSADDSGRRLAAGITTRFSRSMRNNRVLLAGAAERINLFRTSTFVAASRPIRAMRNMSTFTEAIRAVATGEDCGAGYDGNVSLGDYLEMYAHMTTEMAERKQYPFTLFPDIPSTTDVSHLQTSRKSRAMNGMKMNVMASFAVFLRMLRASDAPPSPGHEHEHEQFAAYAEWSTHAALMDSITRRVQSMPLFEHPSRQVVPYVRGTDHSLQFMTIPLRRAEDAGASERKVAEAICNATNEGLVPAITPQNTEFMMHMLDNVLSCLTCPLLAHVDRLKTALATSHRMAVDMERCIHIHNVEFTKNPFVAQVQELKRVQEELSAFGTVYEEGEGRVFTWGTSATGSKKKKSRKNKRPGLVQRA